MLDTPAWIVERLSRSPRTWLFLDYDGTLADFAPSPEIVTPDPQVIDLVSRLAGRSGLRVAVTSGRRLDQVRSLLPVPGVFLAGTYGVELLTPQGERVDRLEYSSVRPVLERLKPHWERAIAGSHEILLEDKGWSLALHARPAGDLSTQKILSAAREAAGEILARPETHDLFREHGQDGFYEICPAVAHKGRAVEYLLDHFPWPESLPLSVGDDYNDEEAFIVVKARGGIAIRAGQDAEPTQADFRLENPQAVREWLGELFLN